MAKRKQFTFYESFYKALAKLPMEEAQQGLWAIATYALYGHETEELTPAADAVFEMARPVLDAAKKKAEGAYASHKVRKQKVDSVRISDGCALDSVCKGEKEKEVEIEKENENEVEAEIENEIEKESLYTDGVCVNRDTDTDRFERFWNLYPNKLGKQKAWEAWQMEKPDLDKLVVALECWKNSRQWRQDNGRFIPKAENFLKEKYVLQVPDGAVPRGASGYLGQAELEAIERLMNGK